MSAAAYAHAIARRMVATAIEDERRRIEDRREHARGGRRATDVVATEPGHCRCGTPLVRWFHRLDSFGGETLLVCPECDDVPVEGSAGGPAAGRRVRASSLQGGR